MNAVGNTNEGGGGGYVAKGAKIGGGGYVAKGAKRGGAFDEKVTSRSSESSSRSIGSSETINQCVEARYEEREGRPIDGTGS